MRHLQCNTTTSADRHPTGDAPQFGKRLFLAKRQLAEFVYDAVNLEGIAFTLPEIQTLLQGVTVGGHTLSDQGIALNQRDAWLLLFEWIQTDNFELSKAKACALHALAAKDDTLAWGCFRSGGVLIAGTDYSPTERIRTGLSF